MHPPVGSVGKIAKVGWIGLGIMGRPMAENLLRRGFEVTGYNRTPARRDAFLRSGGKVAESARAVAAASDVIVTMVSDTADVLEVLFGPDGVVEGAHAGQTAIDMSTISPRATRELAAKLGERGIDHLDAPVSGGESGAIAATLSIMVGGPAVAFERCLPLFDALGKKITHLGDHGAGQSTKLVNQVTVFGTLLSVCEALRLAQGPGSTPRRCSRRSAAGPGRRGSSPSSGRRSSPETSHRAFRCASLGKTCGSCSRPERPPVAAAGNRARATALRRARRGR